MGQVHKIKKGLDIRLVGEVDKVVTGSGALHTIMVSPEDFFGIRPKTLVTAGDEVLAGTPIMFDKNNEAHKIVSPVSGEVVEVVRGAKRKLLGIKILADKDTRYVEHGAVSLSSVSAEDLTEKLCQAGLWSGIKMRPYNAIAFPELKPKAVFVSAFDSAPLAPDFDFVVQGQEEAFELGLQALAKVSGAKVHLGVHAQKTKSTAFLQTKAAQVHTFDGPHPSGLLSTQIGLISPINRGEVVWTSGVQEVIAIGKFIQTGRFDATRLVALTGAGLKQRHYVRTVSGAPMSVLIEEGQTNGAHQRWISGNVLTGRKVGKDSYLGYFDSQVTLIEEGGEPEFFGWIAPGFNKFSLSRTFFSWATPNKKYNLNTSMNGEERAFVVTGEYEKVFPLDILPVHLLKAIITGDIEQQEHLGIYEIVPEDFALCEFVCTSKIESQAIVEGAMLQLYGELVDSMKPEEHHHG